MIIAKSQIDPPSLSCFTVLHRIILHGEKRERGGGEEGSWKKQSCRIGEQRREESIVAKVASRFLNSYLTPTLFLRPWRERGRGKERRRGSFE